MRQPIIDALASGRVLVADGATGTMLQQAGLPPGMPGEFWVRENPQEITRLHRAYLDAGSQIILTSTFGATRTRLRAAGLDDHVDSINLRATEIAREVAGDDIYVAGDIGPTGEMMAPMGKLTFASAREMFAEQAKALSAGPIDCVFIETMSDLNEAKASWVLCR
jgi:methionine synthase I (cobalamin-dependent)